MGALALFGLFAIVLTLILAAVIASFVLGMGSTVADTPPQASFTSTVEGDTMTITLSSGEPIEAENLYVHVDGRRMGWDGTGTVRAGDSMSLTVSSGDQVRVIWENRDSSATMYTETA